MEKTIRNSKQRDAILTLLKSVNNHPDATWIYETLKKENPSLSLGTVYRNLNFLSDRGEIIKIEVNPLKINYDGDISTHSHFVCTKCQTIHDIFKDLEDMKKLGEEKGEVERINVVFYGICNGCKAQMN